MARGSWYQHRAVIYPEGPAVSGDRHRQHQPVLAALGHGGTETVTIHTTLLLRTSKIEVL